MARRRRTPRGAARQQQNKKGEVERGRAHYLSNPLIHHSSRILLGGVCGGNPDRILGKKKKMNSNSGLQYVLHKTRLFAESRNTKRKLQTPPARSGLTTSNTHGVSSWLAS